MSVKVIGIDLGNTVFHVIGMDEHGSIVLKRTFSRSQLLEFLVNTPPCLIGMEASCGCHHVGRQLATLAMMYG
jgi:transposase